tara:strand:- start:182 stop:1030 length:849 start_codon:yes stop_codon:yes gene_type:complete
MDQLITLLQSGMSLQEAIDSLQQDNSNRDIQKFIALVNRGVPLMVAIASFFHWTIPFPFRLSTIPMDTLKFLLVCEHYRSQRQVYVRFVCSQLMYPVFLLSVSTCIIGLLFFHHPLLFNVKWQLFFFAIVGFIYVAFIVCILLFLKRIVSVSVLDILHLVNSCLRQGWSIKFLFDSVCFSASFGKSWQRIYDQAIRHQSFILSLRGTYPMPSTMVDSLLKYERVGHLVEGLDVILPKFQTIEFRRLKWACRSFNAALYIVIVFMILTIVFLVYFPMVNDYLR